GRLVEHRRAHGRLGRVGGPRGPRETHGQYERDDRDRSAIDQLQPQPPPDVPVPPIAPSRFASTCSSAARSCASASSCMMRSASSSRWCGFTVHLEMEQPPTSSVASMKKILIASSEARLCRAELIAGGFGNPFRVPILEKYGECTGVLLDSLGVVCVEDDVVPDVAALRDPLLERHHQPAAHVDHREITGLDGELICLLASERAPGC